METQDWGRAVACGHSAEQGARTLMTVSRRWGSHGACWLFFVVHIDDLGEWASLQRGHSHCLVGAGSW